MQVTVRHANPLSRVAVVQGASYVYFGAWALFRRSHYVERHALRGTSPWVLNAHAGWMALIGGELVRAGAVGGVDARTTTLGLASAAGLAANDAALLGSVAPIYRSDLAWETLLALAWLTSIRRRSP